MLCCYLILGCQFSRVSQVDNRPDAIRHKLSAVFQSLGLIPWYGVCLLAINEQLNLERCDGVRTY